MEELLNMCFLNTMFYEVGMIKHKLSEYFGSYNNYVSFQNENELIVVLRTKPYINKVSNEKYIFKVIPNKASNLNKIIEIKKSEIA